MRRWTILVGVLGGLVVAAAAIAFGATSGARGGPRAAVAAGPALTVRAHPNPAAYGETVDITGHLRGAPHGAVAVTLYQELAGQHHYRRLKVGFLHAGRFRFVRPGRLITSNRRWYVVTDGLRSRTMALRVNVLVTLSTSNIAPAPLQNTTLTGHVTPLHAGERVAIQERQGSRWVTINRVKLDRRSNFSASQSFPSAGTRTIRAAFGGDLRNGAAASGPLLLDVGGNNETGIQKIQHVVIIMQENRSFDEYFGTYPGADGIPGLAGNPGAVPCLPDPYYGGCKQPYLNHQDLNYGGPHGNVNAVGDLNNGAMTGFVGQSENGTNCGPSSANATCSPCKYYRADCDVMGYHDGTDIPNYWNYAQNFVLQDHMFESTLAPSQPSHVFMVSGWTANCNPPGSDNCTNTVQNLNGPLGSPSNNNPLYGWTDITWLLHRAGVSWGYYVFQGTEPDCEIDTQMTCTLSSQKAATGGIWNPLPHFTDVHQDNQLGNIQSLNNFFAAAKAGTLPAVSWVIPNGKVSEHPTGLVSAGQTYVTGLVNTIMESPDWSSTAIFIAWDDWGGFYDSVAPPSVDVNGYGLRVPGLVISPYAKQGYIDHQVLSFDAYNKFIEDDFLGGQRLDPSTDGRPDGRIDVRENEPQLGNLANDFDFNQPPRGPDILPVCPATQLQPPPKC